MQQRAFIRLIMFALALPELLAQPSEQKLNETSTAMKRYESDTNYVALSAKEDTTKNIFVLHPLGLSDGMDSSGAYQVRRFVFNSSVSDFSPAYFGNGIVFVSARKKRGRFQKKVDGSQQAFLDLYYSEQNQGQFAEPVPLGKPVNSAYHEGPMAFYDRETKMIFTRNGYFGGQKNINRQRINRLHLFIAERKAGTPLWGNVRPFPYNSEHYSIGHPTVSADGQQLYLVSDMPGGYGGTDLYVSHRIGRSWGKPQNLGPWINTAGNERFPFIHPNGTLYFSSDGHGGMGGLDVFQVALLEDSTVVKSMGAPVNSRFDDFGLIVHPEENQGFFSSNRAGHQGDDDLYQFTYSPRALSRPPPSRVAVSGSVIFSEEKRHADSAHVVVESLAGEVVAEVNTGPNGTFQFSLEADQSFVITANKQQYIGSQQRINTQASINNLELSLAQQAEVTGSLIQKGTGKKLSHTKLELVDIVTNTKQEQVTDDRGQYVFMVISGHDYQLKVLDKKKFFSQSLLLHRKMMQDGVIKMDQEVEEIVLHKAITINNIYYDVNQVGIRLKAAQELDKLVQLLQNNPSLVIELSAHTDSRGSAEANLALSDRRAKAAAAYIVSQGIHASRIIGKGYGEYKLVNRCADGVHCTEEEHQQNRRTEFAVIKD